jgi:hypothetical protein
LSVGVFYATTRAVSDHLATHQVDRNPQSAIVILQDHQFTVIIDDGNVAGNGNRGCLWGGWAIRTGNTWGCKKQPECDHKDRRNDSLVHDISFIWDSSCLGRALYSLY